MIDWGAAQRVGELIAGSPPFGGVRSASVEPLVQEFAGKVATYSGLSSSAELPSLELVDRPGWIAANLRTMRPLLAPLAESRGRRRGAAGGHAALSVGAVAGRAGGRADGRALPARARASTTWRCSTRRWTPRLLLLAPNLAQAARTLGVDRDELVLWVSIHEITHAVQFSGAPWLREYLGGLLKELIDGLQVTIAGSRRRRQGTEGESDDGGRRHATAGCGCRAAARAAGCPTAQLREIVERARRGELLRLTLGEDRWQLVERMQAAMSLIEGHAEHTMDAIGAEVLPTLPRLRKAMNHRREHRGLPWRVLERLLGLELKLRQYETGRRFCDAVVAGGPQALALAWSGPEALPTPAELEDPSLWIARVAGANFARRG